MLPNPHSVYLHDTPDHSLFNKQERSFSSGCIRLSKPLALAQWLLLLDGKKMSIEDIESRINLGETQTVHLHKPVPVMILYMTAFEDENGTIIFRRDLYQRDHKILNHLRGE